MDGSFVLGNEPAGVHDPGSTFCGINESLNGGMDRADSPAMSRSGVTLWWTREWGMGKGLLASLTLHAVVIALIIVFSTGSVRRQPETITVFLADVGSTGERCSPGEARSPASKRPIPPPGARVSGSVRREPASPGAATPSPRETANRTQTSTMSTTDISALSAALAEQPSAAAEDVAGGQGTAGRAGAGPGGTGSTGSGSSSSAGQGIAGGSDGERKDYLANNFGYIRDLIVKNLKYPYTARQMGWKGSVTVGFVILENGTVETLRVIKSSGHDLLDERVVKTVRALQPFPRPPTRAEVVVPIAFRLE